MTLDSHRPLTYETQNIMRQTDYNIKTPNMEDFQTRDSNGGAVGYLFNAEDEKEDRIRTIQANSDDDNEEGTATSNFDKNGFLKKSSATRPGKASQPRQQQHQSNN